VIAFARGSISATLLSSPKTLKSDEDIMLDGMTLQDLTMKLGFPVILRPESFRSVFFNKTSFGIHAIKNRSRTNCKVHPAHPIRPRILDVGAAEQYPGAIGIDSKSTD